MLNFSFFLYLFYSKVLIATFLCISVNGQDQNIYSDLKKYFIIKWLWYQEKDNLTYPFGSERGACPFVEGHDPAKKTRLFS